MTTFTYKFKKKQLCALEYIFKDFLVIILLIKPEDTDFIIFQADR